MENAGHIVTVREDAEALTDGTLNKSDALIFNTLREGDMALDSDQQNSLKGYISAGNGFVCIHISGFTYLENIIFSFRFLDGMKTDSGF